MATCREKRGGRVYLAKYMNVRENGKVKHKFVRYLGREGPDGKPIRKPRRILDRVDISRTVRYGDVAVMWAIAVNLHFSEIIDKITRSNSDISTGKLLTIWAINRALAPESAMGIPQWVRRTALPELSGVPEKKLNKDRLLRALDDICACDERGDEIYDYTLTIEKKLFRENRTMDADTLAYDLTSTYFYGTTCPLARLGYNRDKKLGRLQIVIALAVTRKDKLPVFHQVYPGNTHDVTTVAEFLATANAFGIENGTIIWDRVLTTEQTLGIARANGYNIIAGLPATRDDVKAVFSMTDNIERIENFIKKYGHGSLYAKAIKTELFGSQHPVVVCLNTAIREDERSERNDALLEIKEKIEELSSEKEHLSEANIHEKISKIVGNYSDMVHLRVKRKNVRPRIEFRFRKHAICEAELGDGRYAILYTEPTLGAKDVVEEYHGKDFIEKVFRTLKQDIAIHPVRHRIPARVRSYVFVCVLGYYLRAMLAAMLRNTNQIPLDDFLDDLSAIQRTMLSYGKSQSIRYLNLGVKTRNTLRALGFSSLFRQVNILPRV